MVTIYGHNIEKVGEKITINQQFIIKLMRNDPFITAHLLAEKIGISKRKIETNIKKLKESGFILRVGSAKSGYWRINNQNE